MNIQDNAQKSSDYYKELKTVRKEIEKIYKQLSKDETLSDMIGVIQNDLGKNINFILTNLTKPNSSYKEFGTKIINILNILINLLKNYTKYKEFAKKEKEDEDEDIIESFNKSLSNLQEDDLNTHILTLTKDDKYDEVKNIIKHICTFNYYKYTFENPTEPQKAAKDGAKDGDDKERERNIELVKEKYRNILNYIQVASFEIFDFVDKKWEKINNSELTQENEKKKKEKKEEKEEKEKKEREAKNFIESFKKDIYFAFINISNSTSVDSESQLYENGNEKVELEARKDLLVKLKEQLDKHLKTLNDIIKYLISSDKQEYLKELVDVQKEFKDYKEKEYSDNILSIIVNEEEEVKKQLEKNSNLKKILSDKAEQDRMRLQRDLDYGVGVRKPPFGSTSGGSINRRKKMSGGERKTNKHYEDKYSQLKKLNERIDALIKKIAETEGKEDDDKDPFSKKSGIFGVTDDDYNSIYNNIWKDYTKEMNKIKSKGVSMSSLKQDRRLYERVKENNLDPQDVLKITFQDKVIFICIILIIRTFAIVLIELLIEYNIVSTLNRGIFIYSVLYMLLLLTGVLIINYDSYKLRILVNYLNIHINSSNIFFHALLFCLFIGLILIIINDDDNNLKSIDNIFNYTYVYKYIYEIAEKSNPSSHLLLSQKEKLKLQYRIDIVTMIIFIFSSLLILIM